MCGPGHPAIFLSVLLVATWGLPVGRAYGPLDFPPALNYSLSDPCGVAGGRAIGSDIVEDFARPIPAPETSFLVLFGVACLIWWRPRHSWTAPT
jgi:hypothetical protein